ncbi:MAG: hypothetical protein DRI34_04650 [Deltaproteobacteria bacterium]|nr:MAG: hypothetical protein DRI34_04650 [Deltaproteobacteria bacterium]
MLSDEPGKVWREVVLLWGLAIAIIAAFKLLDFIPFVRDNLWGIAGIVFLFLPLEFLQRRGEDPRAYGISWQGLGRGLFWAAVLMLIFFPPYIPAYKWWFGRSQAFELHLPSSFWTEVVGYFLLVALPEEAFYRGYLQTRLDSLFKGRVRILGAEVGWSVVIAAAFFAVGHLVEPRLDKLGTFFPGLVFGWLRARTGSIGGAVVFHAMCDIWAQLLRYGYF